MITFSPTNATAAVILFLLSTSCGTMVSVPVAAIDEVTLAAEPADVAGYAATIPLPRRDESVSFHGPGSDQVARGRFPAIRFASDKYELPGDASATLDKVASHLAATGASAILAGFTDPQEENRVLGERRALSVRQGLIERGANPERLQTVSYGHDLPANVGKSDRRVEFGIVSSTRTASAPLESSPVAVSQ